MFHRITVPSSSGSGSPKCLDPAEEGTVIFQNAGLTHQTTVSQHRRLHFQQHYCRFSINRFWRELV